MSGKIAFLRCPLKEGCLSISNVFDIVKNFDLNPTEHIIKNVVFKDLILIYKRSDLVVFVCCKHLQHKTETILQCLKNGKTVLTGDFNSIAKDELEKIKRFPMVDVDNLASYLHGNVNYEKLSRINQKLTNLGCDSKDTETKREVGNTHVSTIADLESVGKYLAPSNLTNEDVELNRMVHIPFLDDYDAYSEIHFELEEELPETMAENMNCECYTNTENRQVCVMRCFLQERCIWATDLHTFLEKNDFITRDCILEGGNVQSDDCDNVKHSDFIVVVVCRHLEQNLRKIKRFLQNFSRKVIISGDLNGIQTRQIFHEFKLFKTSEVSEITSHIRQTLNGNQLEETNVPTMDYNKTTNSIRSSENSENLQHAIDEKTIQQTSVPPTDYDYDHATSTMNNSENRIRYRSTGFVKAHSLQPSKETIGTFVNTRECFPVVLVRTESIDHLKRRFYTVNSQEKTDLIKQVQNVTIISLQNSFDFLGLITLLGIAEYNIQEKIIAILNRLQLDDNIMNRCLRGQHFTVVKWLVGIVKSNYGDSHIVANILPVTCDSVAILYLSTLSNAELSNEMKSEIESFCSEACVSVRHIASTNVGSSKDTLRSLITTLHLLLTELKSRVGFSNSLKIGNLNDALMIPDNRSRLLEHFRHSMCFLEQYACLFFVANQVLRTRDLEIAEFFSQLIRRLLQKAKKKQKINDVLFSALHLVTKTVVFKLENDVEKQSASFGISWKLGKMLNIFLDNDRIPENHCSKLLDLIEPLLLNNDQQIVVNTVYLFRRHNTNTENIRHLFFNVVSKSLEVLNFKATVNGKFTLTDSFKPKWMEVMGSIFDGTSVSLIILIPTLNCVSKGELDEYIQKADKNETNQHLNTLTILHHLNQSSTHRNIMQLLAFQRRPLPIFYVTEKAGSSEFLSYLLDCRTNSAHALNKQQQLKYTLDIINAVSFLHDKKIIHRNITCSAFSVRLNSQTLFLHDFSIATRVLRENGIISDLEDIMIPVLWSAPVSILEDRYDKKTDAWMLGNVIYELFTYGCHPYTEVYNTPTEQILEYILFSDLKLHKWPCIPTEVHAVILGLTKSNPSERLDISAAKTKLSLMLQFEDESNQDKNSDYTIDAVPTQDLPRLDVNQRLPETEIPYLIQQIKCYHGRSISSAKHVYLNTRLSQRIQRRSLAITPVDVIPQDKPRIVKRFGFLDIREAVTLKFLRFLPSIDDEEVFRDLLCLLNSPQKHVVQARQKLSENMFPFYLKYRCVRGTSILDLAFTNVFGDPTMEGYKYMQIVLKVVCFVQEVHRRRIILGDICAEHIYISEDYEKVYMPRLGRMLYYEDRTQECLSGPMYSDRKRWTPIEVLQHGQYSFESDIYRLGMTVYEFFTALDIYRSDPMADQLSCAPFAHIAHKDLLSVLYNGSVPPRPKLCPDWLYMVLLKCWDRDRTRRPSALWIEEVIKRQLGDPLTDIDHSLFTRQLDTEVMEITRQEITPQALHTEHVSDIPLADCNKPNDSNFILSQNKYTRSEQNLLSHQRFPFTHHAWRITSPPHLPNFVNINSASSLYANNSDIRFKSTSFQEKDSILEMQSSKDLKGDNDNQHRHWNPSSYTQLYLPVEQKLQRPNNSRHWVRDVSKLTDDAIGVSKALSTLPYNQTSIEQNKSFVLDELQQRITRGMRDRESRMINKSGYHMTGDNTGEEFV